MPEANEYLDLNELANVAEPLPDDIETKDFTQFKTMPVGNYISQSRTITGTKREDGHLNFVVAFTGGLQYADNGGKTYSATYPLKKWISTKPYKLPDTPGMTSSVAQYLKAVGFNPKGMSVENILVAMQESQTIPVRVYVGRTDKRVKNEATGEWESLNLKTRDFKTGEDADGNPIYGETVTKDGKTYGAAPTVMSFSLIK